MKIEELKIIIKSSHNLRIREFFASKRTIYELIDSDNVKLYTITYFQFLKLKENFNFNIVSETKSGFTVRIYKIKI